MASEKCPSCSKRKSIPDTYSITLKHGDKRISIKDMEGMSCLHCEYLYVSPQQALRNKHRVKKAKEGG